MNSSARFASECRNDYSYYWARCKASVRGDGDHDLWVKLAWRNRQEAKYWESQAAWLAS